MGVLDKFLNVMRLNPDDEDDLFDDDYYDDDEEPTPRKGARREQGGYDEPRIVKDKQKAGSKVTPMRPSRKQGASGMEVCVIKPSSVEDAREITETLLSNRTVVLNVEGVDIDIAQRIIDFTSGSCFAISGNLQKVSNYIFIITPASVDISGDFQDILGSLNNSGLQSGL